ncbi:MAG TPA: Na+/H+ antiporter subunit E [Syntrophomonadaceae bacterium]|nr:Na+/H+ antiporter subunit E [Syntrophomonadaceae bacterium]
MYKRSFILFAFLFTFWIAVSEAVDFQHIIVGIVLSLFTVWFWHDLGLRLPSLLSLRELLLLGRCMLMLVGYVIQSNIDVAKTLLFSNPPVSPIFFEIETGIKSNWGKVFLATCITITPGTITVDIDPETNIFTIHALTRETGEALFYWRIIDEIKNLEKLV